tara:strand:+ start:521 stop:919 length:399 start_codon:yes stop_codon:yes gene_type:complete
MKIVFMLIVTSLLLCCEEKETLNVNYLKENGYKEITCNVVERYQTQESEFIEVNKKFDERKTYLIARCFDKDSCLLNINLNSNKIVCQRYIFSKEDYKKDYSRNDFKEFVDHRVLYLSVDEEDEKEIIRRVN